MGEALGVPVDVADRPLQADAADSAINLLQGAFRARWRARRRVADAPVAALLEGAAGVGRVAVAVFIAGMNGYWLRLQSEATELRSRMTTGVPRRLSRGRDGRTDRPGAAANWHVCARAPASRRRVTSPP